MRGRPLPTRPPGLYLVTQYARPCGIPWLKSRCRCTQLRTAYPQNCLLLATQTWSLPRNADHERGSVVAH